MTDEFFVNHQKKGAFDFQMANREKFTLQDGKKNLVEEINKKKEYYKQLGSQRFGADFIKRYLDKAKILF